MQAKYRILQISQGLFELYEAERLLATFSRQNLRERLEGCNRSSNWVGSILRLLNRKYPAPSVHRYESPLERAESILGEKGLVEYLRSKGLQVVRQLDVPDKAIVERLESLGYAIEGLVEGAYYSTSLNSEKKNGPSGAPEREAGVHATAQGRGDRYE